MKLNPDTLVVLKNFASIQPNIVVPQGNRIKTIAEAKNVMAVAEIDQSFEQEFGIYNLEEFLAVNQLVDNPDLAFSEEYVTVTDTSGLSKIKYFFSDPSILTTATKDIPMPETEVNFTLTEATLNKIRRAASTLGHEKMTITPSDGAVTLTVVDNNDSTSNSFSIDVPGTYEDVPFCLVMNINNLKVIAGDYEVGVSSKLLSNFKNKNLNVEYFIALEKSSTYGE